jgi:hypothetical protein
MCLGHHVTCLADTQTLEYVRLFCATADVLCVVFLRLLTRGTYV